MAGQLVVVERAVLREVLLAEPSARQRHPLLGQVVAPPSGPRWRRPRPGSRRLGWAATGTRPPGASRRPRAAGFAPGRVGVAHLRADLQRHRRRDQREHHQPRSARADVRGQPQHRRAGDREQPARRSSRSGPSAGRRTGSAPGRRRTAPAASGCARRRRRSRARPARTPSTIAASQSRTGTSPGWGRRAAAARRRRTRRTMRRTPPRWVRSAASGARWPSSAPASSATSSEKASGEKASVASTRAGRTRAAGGAAAATQRQQREAAAGQERVEAADHHDERRRDREGDAGAARRRAPHSRCADAAQSEPPSRPAAGDQHAELPDLRRHRVVEHAVGDELVAAGVPVVVPDVEAAVREQPGLEQVRRRVAAGS